MILYILLILLLILLLVIIIFCRNKKEHFNIDDTDLYNYDKSSIPFNNYDINKLVHVMFPCSMKYGYASYNSPSQNGISNCAVIKCPYIEGYKFDNTTCWKCCNYD